jgi:O-antigen/teichoic acid export membrane protein
MLNFFPKRSRARTTRWNLIFQFAFAILSIVHPIILVPFYLRFIPLEVYGAWLATGNILAWIVLINPGLTTVLQQQLGTAYGKQDLVSVWELLLAGLVISGVLASILFIIGWGISHVVFDWINLDLMSPADQRTLHHAFLLAIFATALNMLGFAVAAANLGLQSSLGVGVIAFLSRLAIMITTLGALFYGYSVQSIPIGMIMGGIVSMLGNSLYLILRITREHIIAPVSFGGMQTLIQLSTYNFFSRAGHVIIHNTDAFVAARFLGAELVPMLVLTKRIPQTIEPFATNLARGFMPALSHMVGSGELDRAHVVLMRFISFLLWLVTLILSGTLVFNDDFLRLWVGGDLFPGHMVNVIICVGAALGIVMTSLAILCLSMGDIKWNSLASAVQSLLYIPLVIVGAMYLGLTGIALASLLSLLAVSAWYYPRSFARLLELTRQDVKAIKREVYVCLLLLGSLTGVFWWMPSNTWGQFGISVITFVGVYGIGLLCVSHAFREEVLNVYRKIVPRVAILLRR